MPLYEYRCETCRHRFERIERASRPTDRECPVCGGAARRQLGTPALKFKGSGWYVTDYGKGNGSQPSAADAPQPKPPAATEPADPAAPPKTPTETKPKVA